MFHTKSSQNISLRVHQRFPLFQCNVPRQLFLFWWITKKIRKKFLNILILSLTILSLMIL